LYFLYVTLHDLKKNHAHCIFFHAHGTSLVIRLCEVLEQINSFMKAYHSVINFLIHCFNSAWHLEFWKGWQPITLTICFFNSVLKILRWRRATLLSIFKLIFCQLFSGTYRLYCYCHFILVPSTVYCLLSTVYWLLATGFMHCEPCIWCIL
jgi:hypothetical protein